MNFFSYIKLNNGSKDDEDDDVGSFCIGVGDDEFDSSAFKGFVLLLTYAMPTCLSALTFGLLNVTKNVKKNTLPNVHFCSNGFASLAAF